MKLQLFLVVFVALGVLVAFLWWMASVGLLAG